MAERTTLYAPDGRSYETGSPAEITRLKAYGYSETPPEKLVVPAEPDAAVLEVFDPAGHNVDDVNAFVKDHPELAGAVLAAERQGKNRSSIVG